MARGDPPKRIKEAYLCGIPLKPKPGLTPISCHAVLERSACAPFIKERRMKCINATGLRRKSGRMGHPTFVAGAGAGSLRSQLAPASRLLGMTSWGGIPSEHLLPEFEGVSPALVAEGVELQVPR